MKFTGKIIRFSPFAALTNKDGAAVIGQDGLAVMKRTVCVDCSYEVEGEEVRRRFVCDMWKEFPDEELQKLLVSGEQVTCYINFDMSEYGDGRPFQKVSLSKIIKN